MKALASGAGGRPVDCGTTEPNQPKESVAVCGQITFSRQKPFFFSYEYRFREALELGYGLAADAAGNVFAVNYHDTGYPPVPLNRHMKLADDNHTRITECIKPVALEKTSRGLLACVAPVNQEQSEIAAHQKPIDTTICEILADPPAFNNKLVRIKGRYSGNFEYSDLSSSSCLGSLWFSYGDRGGPPNLALYVSVGHMLGSEDADGKRILPVPVQLVRDLKLERFEKAVKVIPPDEIVPVFSDAPDPRFVTATFVGRIDAVSREVHEYLKTLPEGKRGLGFGQMGQYEAQFVLQSVESDPAME